MCMDVIRQIMQVQVIQTIQQQDFQQIASLAITPAWKPATFDHDGKYFPVYSGSHNGKWNACSDCHTNNSNYAVFSCIACHEHNQTDMTVSIRDTGICIFK